MARQVRVGPVAVDLAVDLEVRGVAALVAPQRVLAERAVFRVKVLVPERWQLDDVAIAIEHREIFARHGGLHCPVLGVYSAAIRRTDASGRNAARTSSSVGHQSGRSISVTRSRMILAGACTL